MTRSTLVAVLSLAIVATACQEPNSPDFGPASVMLIGVVEMSADATPRLGLRHGSILTYLAGKTQDLAAHMGEAVRLTGTYDNAGVFLVESYKLDQGSEEKERGAATSRAP